MLSCCCKEKTVNSLQKQTIFLMKRRFTMKKIITKLAAVSAVAITAISSMGMTAFAYEVDESNINHLTNHYVQNYKLGGEHNYGGAGKVWSTEIQQNDLPAFGTWDLPKTRDVTFVNAEPTDIVGLLKDNIAKINDLATAKMYFDRIKIKSVKENANGKQTDLGYFAAQLEYYKYNKEGLYDFAFRLMDDYHVNQVMNNNLVLDSFNYDDRTGKYTGKLKLENYYYAGMKVSCGDGITTFKEPVLTTYKNNKFICTEIEFSGTIPTLPKYTSRTIPIENDGALYFTSLNRINILNNLKITYNGGSYTTNEFSRGYNVKNNSYYMGTLVSSTLEQKLTGSNRTIFEKNQFTAVRAEGSTLYVCFGSNHDTVPSTSALKSLLKCGGRDTIVFNDWLRGKLSSYKNIVVTYKATATSKGVQLYTCTNPQNFFNEISNMYWG